MFFSRGKNKIQNLHNLRDAYNFYLESVNELYRVDFKIFKDIVTEYYLVVIQDILNNGSEYKLPHRLGRIKVIKRRIDINNLNRFGIDWVESVKNKKQVYHLNNHSRGFVYRFKWEKTNSLVPNLYFYKFVPTRTIKRKLAFIIKNRLCDYYEK